MGKLIKVHWARLVIMTAAAYQVAAGIEGIFWRKIFWDFLTKDFDIIVKPFPILAVINIVFGFIALAFEWPLPLLTLLPRLHACIELRLVLYPLFSLAAVLLYQATNASLYYLIGVVVLFWGFCEGESICAEPWTLPKRELSPLRGKAVELV